MFFISRSIKIFSKAITIKYNISQLNFYNSTSILTITITEGETRSISAKKISRPRRKPGLERDRQGQRRFVGAWCENAMSRQTRASCCVQNNPSPDDPPTISNQLLLRVTNPTQLLNGLTNSLPARQYLLAPVPLSLNPENQPPHPHPPPPVIYRNLLTRQSMNVEKKLNTSNKFDAYIIQQYI